LSRSARDSEATKALISHVEKASTGCLSVGAGAAKVSIYLMSGAILASESLDDHRQLLRMLQLRAALTRKQIDALEAKLESSEPIFGDLLDAAPGPLMERLLVDRFRQNISDFVSSISKPSFAVSKAVFAENIQMGHDSVALIDDCCALVDRSTELNVDAAITLSGSAFDNEEQKLVASQLSPQPRTVSSLLLMVPIEPHLTRNVILDMLAKGTAALDTSDDEDESDAPTFYVADEEPQELQNIGDEDAQPTEQAPVSQASPPKAEETDSGSAGDLSSLNAWIESSSQMVDDDELDFFSDHDYDRGSVQDGAFSTDHHNLDKVEVADMDAPIEADEAPPTRFSAPVLSEDDARGKIQVANEVLEIVVKAFDEVEGSGRGRSLVQLLVDGSPQKYTPLLAELTVSETGTLPEDQVLDHLYARPASEHRQLIHNAMLDIIERVLSSAADELPDEQFDSVFENVAGYRGRMGL